MRIFKMTMAMFVLLMMFLVSKVFAIDLSLTKIGVLSTVGVDYDTVDYTGTIPTLEGVASPSSQVLIQIKTSTDATTAASPSGAWQFTPGVLDIGSNSVVISSGGQSVSFTLNFNATPSATPTQTVIPEVLLETGVWEYFLPMFGAGLLVIFSGKYIKKKMILWEGKKESE